MASDRKINAQLSRSKFAIFLVVGFLALITYLLIVISNQLAQTESVTSESQAAMLNGGIQAGNLRKGGSIGNLEFGDLEVETETNDEKGCYSITGSSGSSLDPDPRRRFCKDLSYQCNNIELSSDKAYAMALEIEAALQQGSYTGSCYLRDQIGSEPLRVMCDPDTQNACEDFGGSRIKQILDRYCQCPGEGTIGDAYNSEDDQKIGRSCGWEFQPTYETKSSPFSRCSKEYTGARIVCADGAVVDFNNGCYTQDELDKRAQASCCS